ncbi:efflux transporter outer membrane subunit [Dyella flagellata]|uniref:Multidrug efflux outer membrane protein OprN n=1 Tax=Dyella flagellata TaxID=1867833 RepID=A0ABQ5XG60_9GAMM|nr:efflux transporter outer membrane subunit [Dyella flagellata]GLQ90685.1 multidrug efflux outer membrane protein OprN [Dyella flagellata]
MISFLRNTTLFAALALAGCVSVGPDYKTPNTQPANVQNIDAARESHTQFQAAWWKQFNDPVLDGLIQRAAKGSLDLRIARARLAESRALLGTAKSDQIPTIDTTIDFQRSREQQPGFGTAQRLSVDSYQAGFDASWEVDLFGGIRRSVEAARGDLGASEASMHDAQVSLFAEVARNYFELRGTQQRLAIAQRNIANQADSLKLIGARAQIGTASEQDVASASAQLSAAKAQLPVLDAQTRAYEYRLAVLLGERPGELEVDVSPTTFKPIATVLPIGEDGDVLARRPDVRIAEREYAAATARIGVAKADFFPHITLGGFVGFLAGRSNDFGGPASRAWSYMPSITWNGLNVERVRSRLHATEARADAAEANYQRTVLQAIEDVDNAVSNYNAEHGRVEQLIAQAQQSRRAAELARVRYQEGATGYLELLDAERVQLAAEDALAQSESAIDTRAVALYKALGGGWQACDDAKCANVAQTP